MIFKYKKISVQFIHTLCDGDLLYRLGLIPNQVAGKVLHEFLPTVSPMEKKKYYQREKGSGLSRLSTCCCPLILVTAGSPKHYLNVEAQLKTIFAYMKAQIVQTYVFIEEKDFHRKEIVNDDVLFRIDRLVEDTIVLTETYTKIREEKEAKYTF